MGFFEDLLDFDGDGKYTVMDDMLEYHYNQQIMKKKKEKERQKQKGSRPFNAIDLDNLDKFDE